MRIYTPIHIGVQIRIQVWVGVQVCNQVQGQVKVKQKVTGSRSLSLSKSKSGLRSKSISRSRRAFLGQDECQVIRIELKVKVGLKSTSNSRSKFNNNVVVIWQTRCDGSPCMQLPRTCNPSHTASAHNQAHADVDLQSHPVQDWLLQRGALRIRSRSRSESRLRLRSRSECGIEIRVIFRHCCHPVLDPDLALNWYEWCLGLSVICSPALGRGQASR